MRATNQERESDDFFLNLAFVCEFILRGAISGVNPALNAADDEESILFSAGVTPNKPAKTADIYTVLTRVVRLIPQITIDERITVSTLLTLRNQELHGDKNAIAEASKENLMPNIYAFIVKVADFAKININELLSESDAIQAKATADALLKDRKRHIQGLISNQKDRFYRLEKHEQDAKREASKPDFISATMNSGHRIKTSKCPACAQSGYLGGSPVGRSAPILKEDGIYQELRIVPNIFECKCCELKIKGLDELMAAGIEHEFRTLDEKM